MTQSTSLSQCVGFQRFRGTQKLRHFVTSKNDRFAPEADVPYAPPYTVLVATPQFRKPWLTLSEVQTALSLGYFAPKARKVRAGMLNPPCCCSIRDLSSILHPP